MPLQARKVRSADGSEDLAAAQSLVDNCRLQETNLLLNQIFQAVGDVIFLIAVEPDGGFRFESVNSTFFHTTGLPPDAVVGRRVDEVIPEPSLSFVLRQYRTAIDERRVVRWEETSSYPRGTLTGSVTVGPIFGEDGICSHLVGSVHDITERKRMEDELRAMERRYRELADAVPQIIWTAGPDGALDGFNARMASYSGVFAEHLTGWNWSRVHPPRRFARTCGRLDGSRALRRAARFGIPHTSGRRRIPVAHRPAVSRARCGRQRRELVRLVYRYRRS
ncbi:MAG: PAS domain S-box protein [Pirellulales bacterium]